MKMALVALALILCVGIVSAAVLIYYGQIITTVNVKQAVLLDGQDYTKMPIKETVPPDLAGGEYFCRYHWLTSQTSVPVNLRFNTTFSPELTDSEIITTYHFANASTVIKTADRLVALQNSSDAGWDWIVTNATAHSKSASATNIYGVTALGLLEAYKLTGNSSYLDAAKKVADAIVAGKSQRTDGSRSIRSPDYRFLVEYGIISGDSTYISYARSKWDSDVANVTYYTSPEAMYNHLATTWMNDTGIDVWELSNFGLSAFAVKDTTWANKAADVVASYPLTINDSDDYRFIGWGNALRFLCTVNATKYSANITSLVTTLKNTQLSDGSWNSDTQDTAYVIMGLNAAGAIDSAKRGVEWLVTTQQSNGGWLAESKEYSETDSEAIQALPIALTQVTLLPHERLDFYICYNFAVNIFPYTYTITTTVKPAP
jgi:hypothetical protein